MRISNRLLAVLAAAAISAGTARAQAFAYPAFQGARIAEREYIFVLGDADGGSTAIAFQWREGLGQPKLQFTLDAGFADGGVGGSTILFFGGGLGYQLATARTDMPFDIVLSGGLGLGFADGVSYTRLPFGASVGHRFPLEGGFAISPFLHPRLAWNRFSAGGGSTSATDLEVEFGGSFEINPRMAVRLAAVMSDADVVGISFVWTPRGIK